ncbi:MAG: VTT domain-containing protein [Patescibacteria group bacterium]
MKFLSAHILKRSTIIITILFFLSISFGLSFFSSDQILGYIGIQNAYLLMFVLAIIGGMSTFTGIPYHFILMSLAASGLNPLLLGMVTAFGVMLGDTTSYMLGKQSSKILPKRFEKPLNQLASWLASHPKLITPSLILYGAFSPFSNDFIVISMGLIRYPYKKLIPPLTIGNIFYNVALAYLGFYAFDSIQAWFGTLSLFH